MGMRCETTAAEVSPSGFELHDSLTSPEQKPCPQCANPGRRVAHTCGRRSKYAGLPRTSMPSGWDCVQHTTSGGYLYKRYRGPNGERAQSLKKAWEMALLGLDTEMDAAEELVMLNSRFRHLHPLSACAVATLAG